MSIRSAARKGFTLVEILIVVVILGILAAIVIPQFTNAAQAANASSMRTQLQTLRSQLELYQIDHFGAFPTLAQLNADNDGDGIEDWQPLTQIHVVNADGTLNFTPAITDQTVGPYIRQAIRNPFADPQNRSTLAAPGTANVNTAFTYDENTGAVRAVVQNQQAINLDLVPNAFGAGNAHPDFLTY